jgi:hypothetical protein
LTRLAEHASGLDYAYYGPLLPSNIFMNSYLTIASKVLSEARQPLSAVQILRAAYDLQIVPRDLYGKTQHKTLQARIAEDSFLRQSALETTSSTLVSGP